jgi:hypothetical protein
MDFRSQLSAFQNSGGTNSSSGRGNRSSNNSNDDGRNNDNRNRSPGRHNNSNNVNWKNHHGREVGDYRGGGSVDPGRSGGDYGRGRGDYGQSRGDQFRGGGGGAGGRGTDGRDFQARGGDYGPGVSDRRRPRPQEWNDPHQGASNVRRRINASDPDGLGDLREFGYRIPKGFPDPPTPQEMARKPKHLALLAITISDLPYEHIWKGWCDKLSKTLSEEDEDDQYFISLVCHGKYPKKVRSEWLRHRLLTHPPKPGRGNSYMDPEFFSLTPSWGSVEITRAMLDLLQDGLKIGNCTEADKRFSASRFLIRSPASFDANAASTAAPNDTDSANGGSITRIPPVDHFLYISETCLPVVTPQEFFARIQDSTVSWVNARHRKQEGTPRNKYEDDQFAGINRRVPGQYRWKGDQWVLLSRRHASKIIELDRPHISPKHQLWQSFNAINASDEMYIPTVLALLGYLRFTADGDDTQRPRDPHAISLSASGSDKEGAPTSDPSASVSKNECILLKPVTYTDWSAGMKNPVTFSHGVTDLRRIGKIAREKGCLVARKFAPYIAVPGFPRGEQNITGEISLADWDATVQELRSMEEAEASAKQNIVKTKDVTGETTSTKEPDKLEEEDDAGQSYENSHVAVESTFQSSDPANAEGPDDDEEENQLE